MIGALAGIVVHRGTDHVILDVQGVGYLLQVSERTLAGLPPEGGRAALWTELVVREDALTLLGFPSLLEKEWHRLLVTVRGVGTKAAMSLLATLGPQALGRALALGDWGSLRAAPGIGPKSAQRIVMELKDKAATVMALPAAGRPPPMSGAGPLPPVPPGAAQDGQPATPATPPEAAASVPPPASPPANPLPGPLPETEALSALTNLGYAPPEAAAAVAAAAGEDPEATTPALIRAALKRLAPAP